MLRAPADTVFVEIKNRYEEELKFDSGVTLFVDPTYNPNFHATMEGIVHSVPKTLKYDNRNIDAIIRPGDEILFSYKLIGDITHDGGPQLFRMTTKEEGYFTEWMNAEREMIRMEKHFSGRWAAVYTDTRGNLIAGKVGSGGEVENWVATNFKFATSEGFTYDNQFQYDGKELWRVDYSYVFAIRRNGRLNMVGDYVLVEPIVEKRSKMISLSLERPEGDRHCILENKGWCRYGGSKRFGFRDGDVVLFDPDLKEKYNFRGRPMYIVKRQYVFGREMKIVLTASDN